MGERDTPTGLSRLDDSKKTIGLLIAEAGELDEDGITVWCFDTDIHDINENTTDAKAQTVLKAARANGQGTYHAKALQPRVDDYLDQLLGKPGVKGTKGGLFSKGTPDVPAVAANPNTKPRLYVVITDGQPSDGSTGEKALETLIINATKRLGSRRLRSRQDRLLVHPDRQGQGCLGVPRAPQQRPRRQGRRVRLRQLPDRRRVRRSEHQADPREGSRRLSSTAAEVRSIVVREAVLPFGGCSFPLS